MGLKIDVTSRNYILFNMVKQTDTNTYIYWKEGCSSKYTHNLWQLKLNARSILYHSTRYM